MTEAMTLRTTMSLTEGSAILPVTVLSRNKAILLTALAQRGVCSATVTYSGASNSGSIESMTFEIAEGPALDESAPISCSSNEATFRMATDSRRRTHQ